MAASNQQPASKFKLPEKRRFSFAELIDQLSTWKIVTGGIVIYTVIVLVFSAIEWLLGVNGNYENKIQTIAFGDLVYFNFISILTIGYGDLSPLGIFRVLTII